MHYINIGDTVFMTAGSRIGQKGVVVTIFPRGWYGIEFDNTTEIIYYSKDFKLLSNPFF